MPLMLTDVVYGSREGLWSQVCADRQEALRELGADVLADAQMHWNRSFIAVLSRAASVLNRMHGGNFRKEIKELARLAETTPGRIIVANMLYDFYAGACSTFLQTNEEGVLHARNLDWQCRGDLLRKHTLVLRVHNAPAGDYTSVTWPGLFGMTTGMAPGRFSISVNYVRHSLSSMSSLFVCRAASGYVPVTWAVRSVFDHACCYRDAVKWLGEAKLLAPVILVIAGVNPGEGCVIERTPTIETRRTFSKNNFPLLATNHYTNPLFIAENCEDFEPLMTDSLERFMVLCRLFREPHLVKPSQAMQVLSLPNVIVPDTQHQVVMRPRDGLMHVQVPGEPMLDASY